MGVFRVFKIVQLIQLHVDNIPSVIQQCDLRLYDNNIHIFINNEIFT